MKSSTHRERRALRLALLIAILFYSALPNFGWAWHRVLPEHTHLFVGASYRHALAPYQDDAGARDPNFIHLPASSASILIFAIVVCMFAIFVVPMPAGFSFCVRDLTFSSSAPCLPPPDPPPTARDVSPPSSSQKIPGGFL